MGAEVTGDRKTMTTLQELRKDLILRLKGLREKPPSLSLNKEQILLRANERFIFPSCGKTSILICDKIGVLSQLCHVIPIEETEMTELQEMESV